MVCVWFVFGKYLTLSLNNFKIINFFFIVRGTAGPLRGPSLLWVFFIERFSSFFKQINLLLLCVLLKFDQAIFFALANWALHFFFCALARSKLRSSSLGWQSIKNYCKYFCDIFVLKYPREALRDLLRASVQEIFKKFPFQTWSKRIITKITFNLKHAKNVNLKMILIITRSTQVWKGNFFCTCKLGFALFFCALARNKFRSASLGWQSRKNYCKYFCYMFALKYPREALRKLLRASAQKMFKKFSFQTWPKRIIIYHF